MKIGVLLYTYNRIDDARINMEIIRNLWQKNPALSDMVIVHAFNGEKQWWPEKYLEDDLIYLENPGHFAGAEILLNTGVKHFAEIYPEIEHVVILAADTWCVKPEYIAQVIQSMRTHEQYLATCAWGTRTKNNIWNIGMAIDFCIVNIPWAMRYGLFPIRYQEFFEKYGESFWYRDELIFPERVLAVRFKQAVSKFVKLPSENLLKEVAARYMYRMSEREPVHRDIQFFGIRIRKDRDMYFPNIGLITHHIPAPKRDILKKIKNLNGQYIHKLLTAADLNYYNQGLGKNTFAKGATRIVSGD